MEDTLPGPTMEMSASFLVLVSSILFGGVIIAVGYFVRRFSRAKHQKDESQNVQKPEEHRRDSLSTSRTTVVGGNSGVSASSNKRAKNKKRRGIQQEFSHSWVVGTLKGHTAPVLDINFSSNGKFLASCAEDCGLRSKEEVLEPAAERYEKVGNRETSSTAKTTGSESTEPTSSSSAMEPINRWMMKPPTAKRYPMFSPSMVQYLTRNYGLHPYEMSDDYDVDPHAYETLDPYEMDPHAYETLDDYVVGSHLYETSDDYVVDPPPAQNSYSRSSTSMLGRYDDTPSYWRAREALRNATMISVYPEEQPHSAAVARRSMTKQENVYMNSERKALAFLSDAKLHSLLGKYILTGDETWALGYPTPSGTNTTLVGNFVKYNQVKKPRLDVNAREFVPRLKCTSWTVNAREFIPRLKYTSWTLNESEGDSGNGSGSSENSDLEAESSSDSEKENVEPSLATSSSSDSDSQSLHDLNIKASRLSAKSRHCARCSKVYFVHRETGQPVVEETCIYHWGKIRTGYYDSKNGYVADSWSCCKGGASARGCTTYTQHVWTGWEYGCNGPFTDFIRTKPASRRVYDGDYGVYSVDCEMCFTARGLELTKVSIVALDGAVIYDTLVKPEVEIVDYNTRFSGITPELLAKATKTLKEVQRDILTFVYEETILMGHGLENDLRALRLVHSNVVDTSIVYPHTRGYPYRSSLQTVTSIVLNQAIQNGHHDSVEDARAVLSLMLRKVNDDIS